MPISGDDALVRNDSESITSPLGQSLLRIHKGIKQASRDETRAESVFKSWQTNWSGRRDQIARRLAIIEDQLERFAQNQAEPSPQLSIYNMPAVETDEFMSMSGF